MKYRSFKLSDDNAINAFLAQNRETIGKDQVNIGEDRISFIVLERFDGPLATKLHKPGMWITG